MSRGINKVILIGNLGHDPETRATASGTSVTNLSVATDESYKDKQTGQKVEKTEWHKVAIFSRLAEIAAQYLRKGSKVYIEGKLSTRKWEDQAGVERYTTEIIANEMRMLDSRSDNAQGTAPAAQPAADYRGHSGSNQKNPSYAPPQASPMASNPRGAQSSYQPPVDDFDDDIPF